MDLKKKFVTILCSLALCFGMIASPSLGEEYAEIKIRSMDSTGKLLSGIRYTIKDEGGNLLKFRVSGNNEYQVSSSGTYVQVTSGDDDIKITNIPFGTYAISDLAEEGLSSDEKSQIVRADREDLFLTEFHFTKRTGSIKITLQSEDGKPLAGKSFSLKGAANNKLLFSQKIEGMEYSENVGTTDLKTRDDGSLYLYNIPYGDYQIEQVLKDGEYIANPYKQMINITSNDAKNINITNKAIKQFGDLTIMVKNEMDEAVGSASFEIVDKNGNKINFSGTTYSKESTVSSFTIPESGKLELKGIPVGDYFLKQTITPFPYSKSDDLSFTIDVKKQNALQVLQKISHGELEIKKIDEMSSQAIQGHKFSILNKEDSSAIKFLKTDQGYVFDKAGAETVLITDVDGIISVKKLPEMTVMIKEIEPASNYLPNEDVVEKKIKANEKTSFISKSKKPSVILETRNRTGEIVPRVTIDVIDKNNELIFSRTSAEETGEIEFSDLTEGDYKIQVKEVPEGYCFPPEPKEFKVEKTGVITGLSDFFIPEVIIIASLAEPGATSFEGGRFVLFKDGEKFAEEETNKEGFVRFTRLPYGKYSIKQIAAPMGFELSEKEFNFVVDKNYVNGDAYLFAEDHSLISKDKKEEGAISSSEKTSHEKELDKKSSKLPYIILGIFALMFIVAVFFILKNGKGSVDEDDEEDNSDLKK